MIKPLLAIVGLCASILFPPLLVVVAPMLCVWAHRSEQVRFRQLERQRQAAAIKRDRSVGKFFSS